MLERRLEHIDEETEKILEIVTPFFEEIPQDILNSEFPKTSRLIYFLISKIKEITQGIFDTTFNFNNYSSNILLRVLIEHFLTFAYVLERLSEDENDYVGEEYYEQRSIVEEKDFKKSLLKQVEVTSLEDKYPNIKEIIDKEKPDNNNYTKKELDGITSQFKIGAIIKYLIRKIDFETIGLDEEVKELHFVEYFTHYSYLSSYIHGGPLSERLLIKYKDLQKRDKRLRNVAETSFAIFHGAVLLGLTIFWKITDNKNYFELSEKVSKIELKED